MKNIREIVNRKEKKPAEKKPARRTYYLWLPVICMGLIAGGLMVSRQRPSLIISQNPDPIPGITVEQPPPALKKTKPQRPEIGAKEIEPAIETIRKTGILSTKENDHLEKRALSRPAAPRPPEKRLNPKNPVDTKTADPHKPTDHGKPSGILISRIVSCDGVSKKQYVSPKTTFSLKDNPTPVVWMKVLSDNPPFTLTHVYYVNGRRYCEVPLEIRYPHMRTWSNVTLSHSNHIGQWRVEVITGNGEILEQIEFTVVP